MWQLDEPDSVYQKKRSKSSKVAFKKHTSVQTQKHIHLCTHTHAHTRTHTSHILICTNTHAHTLVHTHLCTHTHAQIDRNTRTLKYTLSHTRTSIELDVHHLISQLIKSTGARIHTRTQVNTCVRAHVICCRVLTLPCYPLFDLINVTKKRPKIKNQFKERKKEKRQIIGYQFNRFKVFTSDLFRNFYKYFVQSVPFCPDPGIWKLSLLGPDLIFRAERHF